MQNWQDTSQTSATPRVELESSALKRLLAALDGLDGQLDRRLAELDSLLAATPVDMAAIERQVEAIASTLAINATTASVRHGPDEPIRQVLRLLATAPLSEALEKRRNTLAKRQREDGGCCDETLAVLEAALEELSQPGIARRWFGRGRDPDRPIRKVGAATVPAGARQALSALLDCLVLPESVSAASDRLRARLSTSLPIDELAGVIERMIALVGQATQLESEQLERFLQGLSGRFTDLENFLTDFRQDLGADSEDKRALDTGIRGGVNEMRSALGSASSLATLRRQLDSRLKTMVAELDGFARRAEQRREHAEQRVDDLQGRLQAAEAETDALRRSLLQQQMRTQIDPLTRIANREAYNQRLEYEYARWQRGRKPLTLVFADIDRFKPINDRLGHAAGDRVLQSVAEVLSESLRRTDLVARYGGEEFVILMPETDSDEAARVTEKLRDAMEQRDFGSAANRLSVTMSFGLAEFSPGDTPNDVLDRADRALYQAKGAGRNRLVIAPLADPHSERR